MIITVDITPLEVNALELLARGRQIKIVAGTDSARPEDRAIAKVLVAAREQHPEAFES